ncbi:MAG: penicillin-binding transpeptidase domain-containing protein [Acidimicrobiales bacterium]
MRRRRRRLALRLGPVGAPKKSSRGKGLHTPARPAARLRHPLRGARFYPKPKSPRPPRRKEARTPRMRPKKSVVDRVKPTGEPSAPRTIIRLRVIGLLVTALFALMFVRLWYLQVLDSSAYSQTVAANQVRSVQIPPPRGLILDRAGTTLVGDAVTRNITLARVAAQQHPEVVGTLSALLNIPIATIEDALNNDQFSLYEPVPVLIDAPLSDILYIGEHAAEFPGVSVSSGTQLTYPLGQTGVQMLGYVRQINGAELKAHSAQGYQLGDEYGQDGLENQYESSLRGTPGVNDVEVNAQGQVVGSLGQKAPKAGDDVVTNIDSGLEQTLQSALANEISTLEGTVDSSTGKVEHPTGGAAVALDPQTGAVLALVSNPTYDPTIWNSTDITQAELNQLGSAQGDNAINGFYTPGSTFKLATATAALQSGLITPGYVYDDTGTFTITNCQTGGLGCNPLRDNEGESAGYVTVTQALTVSSDTFFYNIGDKFWDARSQYGEQPIQNVANQYSYGEKTGIDLPGEDAGDYARVDSPSIRIKEHAQFPTIYSDQWHTGDSVQMAFGQGGTAITPVEQAVAYATFANGGTRYVPQIAAGIVSPSGKVVNTFAPRVVGHVTLSAADHAAMLAGFVGAVQSTAPHDLGTAADAFAGFPFSQMSIAGKTGTASANEQVPTSWFVGWGPVADPQYLIAVVIEKGGYGASAAAPVARAGFEYLLAHPESPVRLAAPSASSGGTTTTTTAPVTGTGGTPASTTTPKR